MVSVDLAKKFLDEAVNKVNINNIRLHIENEKTIRVYYSCQNLGITYNPRVKVYGDIPLVIDRIKELKGISARVKEYKENYSEDC